MGKYTSLSQQQILILRKAIRVLMEFSNARDENPLFDAGMTDEEGDFVREFYQLSINEKEIGSFQGLEDLSCVPLPALLLEIKKRDGVQLNSISLPKELTDDELMALPRGGWQRVEKQSVPYDGACEFCACVEGIVAIHERNIESACAQHEERYGKVLADNFKAEQK